MEVQRTRNLHAVPVRCTSNNAAETVFYRRFAATQLHLPLDIHAS